MDRDNISPLIFRHAAVTNDFGPGSKASQDAEIWRLFRKLRDKGL